MKKEAFSGELNARKKTEKPQARKQETGTRRVGDLGARAAQRANEESQYEYGELSKDHPLQLFVDRLAKKIPQKKEFPLRIRIAPMWKSTNACAFGDGMIVLSRQLIEQVETEEALLGVIAHEYVHVQREHLRKIQRKQQEVRPDDELREAARTYLESVSVERMSEYEADLRGTLVLLKEAGISPIGYKLFLEKLHEKESLTYGRSEAHGSSMDRALNITDAAFAFHLPATEKELHALPETLVQSFERHEWRMPPGVLMRKPDRLGRGAEEVARSAKERREAITQLRDEELPFAIDAVHQQFLEERRKKKKETTASDAEEVLRQLEREFERRFVPQKPEEQARGYLSSFALSYFCNEDIPPPDRLPASAEEFEEFFTSLERFQRTTTLRYSIARPRSSMHSMENALVARACQQGLFGDFSTGSIDMEKIRAFLERSSRVLGSYSAQFDTSHVWTQEELMEVGVNAAVKTAGEAPAGEVIRRAFPPKKKTAEPVKADPKEVAAAEEIGRALASKFSLAERQKCVDEVLAELERLSPGSTMAAASHRAIVANDALSRRLVERVPLDKSGQRPDEGTEVFLLGDYLELFIAQRSLERCAEFQQCSPLEREAIMRRVGVEFNVPRLKKNAESELETIREYGHSEENFRLMTQSFQISGLASKEIRGIVKNLEIFERADELSRPLTDAELDRVYTIFFDEAFVKENVGYRPAHVIAPPRRVLEMLFVDNVASQLAAGSLSAAIERLRAFESRGIDLQKHLRSQSSRCGALLDRLADSLGSAELRQMPIQDLLLMSEWVSNPFLRAQLQRLLKAGFWTKASFQEKLDLVLPAGASSSFNDQVSREQFFEEDVTTPEQFEAVKRRLNESIDDVLSEGRASLGAAALLDISLKQRQPEEVIQLFKALLTSGENERPLKTILFEFQPKGVFDVTERILRAEKQSRLVYSLDDMGKHILLRKLLASEGGVLPDPERRKPFLKMLFEEWLTGDGKQKDIQAVLHRVREELGSVEQWELLYVAFQNSLRDLICVPPKKDGQVDWHDLYEVEEDFAEEHEQRDERGDPATSLEAFMKTVVPDAKMVAHMKRLPAKYAQAYSTYAEGRLMKKMEGMGVVAPPRHEKLSPLQFTKEMVGKMSALGVRFLQNLPLITEIPETYEKEFSQVFDQMKGQSKLSALMVLEEQWPEVWGQFASIGKRIGGGSIVTVYEATTRKGEEEVIKVLNPNIAYHIQAIHQLASDVLRRMAKKYGGAYTAAELLLTDIKDWIEKDIGFEHALEEDREFRAAHHGFRAAGFDYALYVPQSKGPSNSYFFREEKKVGTNLTQWDTLLDAGHDMKQVISTLARSYLSQIQQGRALSDIHGGNFSVTPEKEIVVYDRNYLLQFSPLEREVIAAFFNTGVTENDKVALLRRVLTDVGQRETESSQQHLTHFVHAVQQHRWKDAQRSLIDLKQSGVRMPLHFTLLLKNLNALQHMARRAGFTGLFEAFAHSKEKLPA